MVSTLSLKQVLMSAMAIHVSAGLSIPRANDGGKDVAGEKAFATAVSTCADLAQANNGTDASACIDAIAAVASGISPEDIVTAATKLLGGADSGSGLGDLLGARQSSDKSDEVKKGLEKATDIIGKIVKGASSLASRDSSSDEAEEGLEKAMEIIGKVMKGVSSLASRDSSNDEAEEGLEKAMEIIGKVIKGASSLAGRDSSNEDGDEAEEGLEKVMEIIGKVIKGASGLASKVGGI